MTARNAVSTAFVGQRRPPTCGLLLLASAAIRAFRDRRTRTALRSGGPVLLDGVSRRKSALHRETTIPPLVNAHRIRLQTTLTEHSPEVTRWMGDGWQ